MSIREAFDKFMAKDFKKAVDLATKATWGEAGYSIELFDDGSYRVLWNENISSRYQSAGLILPVPMLTQDEWNALDSWYFYAKAENDFRLIFDEHWQANQKAQAIINPRKDYE